jgi:hypothetical protein
VTTTSFLVSQFLSNQKSSSSRGQDLEACSLSTFQIYSQVTVKICCLVMGVILSSTGASLSRADIFLPLNVTRELCFETAASFPFVIFGLESLLDPRSQVWTGVFVTGKVR